MKTIAFIPARGGSVSIKKKNIKLLYRKPLIFWVAQACQNCKQIDEVVIATDDPEIKRIALSFDFNKLKVYDRNTENATNKASTESVMLEYIEQANLSSTDQFILVQATSPLTSSEDLSNAFNLYHSGIYDSILTCAPVKRFIWSRDGKPVNYDPWNRPRRQDFEGTLIENGAFYINSVENIKKYKNRICGNIGVFVMSQETSIELDEEMDWILVEGLMKKKIPLLYNQGYDIKLVLTDVDGVLTDAGMYYSQFGDELKKFSTYDGLAFAILKKHNIKVGIITSEETDLTRRRANKLKLDYQFHGVKDKIEILNELCKKERIHLGNVAYIGDDINDLEVLQSVGLSACPANARPEVKSLSGIIKLSTKGGEGALREFIDYIIPDLKT